MKKISKKIVSLVTLAAFALTLVPAAAFAATGSVDGTTAEVSAVDYDTAKVTIDVNEQDITDGGNIVVWATDSKDAVVPQSEVSYDAVTGTTVQPDYADWEGSVVLLLPEAAGEVSLEATFDNVGEYTIHVGLNDSSAPNLAAVTNEVTVTNAAFYAYPALSEQSQYGVAEGDKIVSEATVAVDTDLETTFYVNHRGGTETGDVLDNVVVWAENEKGEVTGLSEVTAGKDANLEVVGPADLPNTDRNGFKLANVANGDTLNVQFDAAGKYTLYAGVGTEYAEAKDATLDKTGTKTTVTVTDDSEITKLDLTANKGDMKFDKDTNTYTLDLTGTNFKFDGNDEIKIDGTAYVGDKLAAGKTINFEATAPNSVVEFWNTDNYTGNDGKFGTTITMQDKQNALITITDEEGNVEYTLRIVALKTTATNIDRTLTGGYVLAGTDKDYADAVYSGKTVKFDNAVEFEVTDQKGKPVSDANLGAIIDVKDKTNKKSTLDNDDLSLVSLGNGKYTLAYKGTDYATDLLPGEYTVRVSLPSEDNATVTFTAAEFGKIDDVQIELNTDNNVKLDDEIMLGDTVNVGLVYVDDNGIKVPCNEKFNWSVKNDAHAVEADTDYAQHQFSLKADTIEHQGVIGSEVTVQAAVPGYGLVEKTLTIVDSYNVYSLEFDPTEGPVNEYNKVDVTVLEDDGDVARVNGTVHAILADSSNEDAKVSVEVEKDQLVIYSDQETVLDVVVTVNDGNEIIAAGTLEYTVGKEDPLANRTVVMTIGSTDYVVNNNIITGDAAPYVDSNWRTMVPIRALAESFDAEVIWNQDDSTVTINFDGDTQIVMTVGETAYTVDGVEAEMDTEPVNTGDRVYVPIRFAAEGLGFGVTPLYDDAGLTASVVFQR